LEGFLGVGGLQDFVPFVLQLHGDHLPDKVLVLNEEDPQPGAPRFRLGALSIGFTTGIALLIDRKPEKHAGAGAWLALD
jgi:hypothetical protein